MEKINPCPFCGGTKIKYSTKTVSSIGIAYVHSTFHCTTCRAYGPRVTSPAISGADYSTRSKAKQDAQAMEIALERWNKRSI